MGGFPSDPAAIAAAGQEENMKHIVMALSLMPCGAFAQEIGATFHHLNGNEAGSARLVNTQGGVLIGLELGGLPPETWLAFHAHETGQCDAAGGFESAGDHFNPAGVQHGFRAETGPHVGDMPNLHSDAQGRIRAEVFNPHVTLTEGEASLLGRALVVHAGSDDYASQPAGKAGDRLLCAVIE